MSVSALAGDEHSEHPLHLGVDAAYARPEREDEWDVAAHLKVSVPVLPRVDVTAFALLSPTYGKAYMGPTLHLARWLVFTPSVGVETYEEMALRGALSMGISATHFNFFATAEYGGSGFWYRFLTVYSAAHDHVKIGVMGQRYHGIGPRIGMESHRIELWGAAVYDPEVALPRAIVGIEWAP